MSRIGKKPIVIPQGVVVTIDKTRCHVKGPKGELSTNLPKLGLAFAKIDGGNFVVSRKDDSREARMEHGLLRALVANMINGVVKEFTRELDIVGVGYKSEVKGSILNLNLGFSHPIEFAIPKGLHIKVDKQTHITISGADKALVGEISAQIRRLRPPEPYNGKGIKYSDEIIKRKVGKAAVGATGAAGGAK